MLVTQEEVAELITVINNHNIVSMYRMTSPPEDADGGDRRISDEPLYATTTLADLADKARVVFWSRGSIADAEKWGLDTDRLGELISEAVRHGKYRNSEWCLQKPGGPWAACDVYVVTVQEWNEAAHKLLSTTYYLKVALSINGQVLLSASNHPEGT